MEKREDLQKKLPLKDCPWVNWTTVNISHKVKINNCNKKYCKTKPTACEGSLIV